MSKIRLALLSDGPADSPKTNSGVAYGVRTALLTRSDVEVVAEIDARVLRVGRLFARALSFRPSKAAWDVATSWGLAIIVIRSLKRALALLRLPRDVVVLHVRNTYLPSRRPYCAFIDTTHNLRRIHWPEPGMSRLRYRFLIGYERRYLRRAAFVFTSSDVARADVVASYGVRADRAVTVNAGLTLPWPVRSRPSIPGAATILFVGKDFRRKGGETLLAALALVRTVVPLARLIVVGPSREGMPEVDGVDFIGPCDSPDALSKMYASAAVFCLPAHFEPFGLVVLEAMAHGVPCVVSGFGPAPAIVQRHGAGFAVPPGDPVELSRALIRVLTEKGLAERQSLAARAAAKAFTWDAVASCMVSSLCDVERSRDGRDRVS